MIKSFRHRGLARFFEQGDHRGIRPDMVDRIAARLHVLDGATTVNDMNIPGWRLHQRKGRKPRPWSIDVSGPWRILFEWGEDGHAYDVDLRQDH